MNKQISRINVLTQVVGPVLETDLVKGKHFVIPYEENSFVNAVLVEATELGYLFYYGEKYHLSKLIDKADIDKIYMP